MAKSLPEQWRLEAAMARRIGADPQATTLEKCAAELESLEREEGLRLVTLHDAVALTGYSYSALEKGIRAGRIPNAGTKHRPRIRAVDLPRKPRTTIRVEPGPDLAERVLAHRK
jgi:hypothetical protein